MTRPDRDSPAPSESTDDEGAAKAIGACMLVAAVLAGLVGGIRQSNGLLAFTVSLVLAGAVLLFEESIRGTFVTSVGRTARIVGAFAIGCGLLGELVALDGHGRLFAGALTLVVVGALARLEGAVVERRRP
jgi:hypothetical protein